MNFQQLITNFQLTGLLLDNWFIGNYWLFLVQYSTWQAVKEGGLEALLFVSLRGFIFDKLTKSAFDPAGFILM